MIHGLCHYSSSSDRSDNECIDCMQVLNVGKQMRSMELFTCFQVMYNTRSIISSFTILNKHYTYTLDRNVYDEDDDDDKNDKEDTESRRTRKIWIMRMRRKIWIAE